MDHRGVAQYVERLSQDLMGMLIETGEIMQQAVDGVSLSRLRVVRGKISELEDALWEIFNSCPHGQYGLDDVVDCPFEKEG